MKLKDWLSRATHRTIILPPYTTEDRSLLHRAWTLMLSVAFLAFLLVYGFFFALTAPYLIVPMAIPLIALAALAIWALPDMRRAPTNLVEVLLFAFFICLIAWPNYLAVSLPGMPWVTLIRLTGFPMALTLLVCVSVSKEFREQTKSALDATPLIYRLLVIFVVIQFLSVAMSSNIPGSLQKLIVAQVNWTAIFFASVYVFLRPGRAERWAVLLWIVMAAIAMIGIVEMERHKVLWAGHIPSFLKVDDERVQGILSAAMRRATGQYRVKATFTTPLGLAEFLALSMPFIVHFALGPFRTPIRVAAAVSLPIFFQVVIMTDSRLGVVGSFLSVLLYTLFWGVLQWRKNKQSFIGPVVVLAYPAVFCAAIAATFFVTRLRRMVWGGGAEQASNQGRMNQIERGLPKVMANPFGHGIGEGAETLGVVARGGMLTIDNYYLLIVLEYGVLGFLVYYGMILSAIVYSGREALRPTEDREMTLLVPLCVTLTNFFVIKSVFSQQDNHPLIFMMLGMVVALIYRKRQTEKAARQSG